VSDWLLRPRADGWAKYCDRRFCMSVCLYVSHFLPVCSHISKTTRLNSIKFFLPVIRGCGSVLLWRQCNTLCTSRFVDDVLFAHSGANRPKKCACWCTSTVFSRYLRNFSLVQHMDGKLLAVADVVRLEMKICIYQKLSRIKQWHRRP